MTSKVQKTLLLFLVLGLGLIAGVYFGYPGYMSARQARLLEGAKDYLAQPDPHRALLCLQLALRHNQRDVEACRLMAQLAEAERSPAALLWRRPGRGLLACC